MNQTLPPPVVSPPSPTVTRKRRWPWIVGGVAVIAIVGGAAGAGAGTDDTASLATEEAPEAPVAPAAAPATSVAPGVPDPAPVVTEAPVSDMTPSQENAVRSAESYLDTMGFSRQGLIDQLSSEYGEQFPEADAVFAVDLLAPDWNAEAVESAGSYLDSMGFSREGLIDQLSSEFGGQFTVEQATYAAAQTGLG